MEDIILYGGLFVLNFCLAWLIGYFIGERTATQRTEASTALYELKRMQRAAASAVKPGLSAPVAPPVPPKNELPAFPEIKQPVAAVLPVVKRKGGRPRKVKAEDFINQG